MHQHVPDVPGGANHLWWYPIRQCGLTALIFNQLVKVLRYDLQVTIHEGLMETQMDLLEVKAGFIDHFQTKMATLSPPKCMPFSTIFTPDGVVVKLCSMPFARQKCQLGQNPSCKMVLPNCCWTSTQLSQITRSPSTRNR